MSSWFNKRLSTTKKTIDHRAMFLCKLLAKSIDEDTYEQVRHRLERCGGIDTRVQITVDGWMSGSKKTERSLPMEFYPIDSVHALTVDSIHRNVLICVIRCFGAGGDTLQHSTSSTAETSNFPASVSDLPFQIIAYKFENESLPQRYVKCFNSITNVVPEKVDERSSGSSKKKSRFSRKKNLKSNVSSSTGADADETMAASVGTVPRKSLLPGRPATAGVGTLAVDRWTARDRLTPKLFASASLDNLLGDDDGDAMGRRTTTKKKKTQVVATIGRSLSYEGLVDDTDPVYANIEYHNQVLFDDEVTGDDVVVDDLDEEAAAAGADFWDEPEDDRENNVGSSMGKPSAYTIRNQFRSAAIPADVVFRRPAGATLTTWSSMDNIADRRSIDNWSSGGDSSDHSASGFEVIRCRDVGVTARFPAATDPKSRPERMDYFRFDTSDETRAVIGNYVADAQCQVDMPRLRAELSDVTGTSNNNNYDVKTTKKNTIETFVVNKMVFSDEESNDDVEEDDSDGWDFGSDDGNSTAPSTKSVVNESVTKSITTSSSSKTKFVVTPTSSSCISTPPPIARLSSAVVVPDNGRSGSAKVIPDKSLEDVQRVTDRPVVVTSNSTRRERLQSQLSVVAVPVGYHRRHHSDSGATYIFYQQQQQQVRDLHRTTSKVNSTSTRAADPVRRRARPQTFVSKSGPRSVTSASSSLSSVSRSTSGRRILQTSTVYIQPTFEHHYRVRSSSSSTGSSVIAAPPSSPRLPPSSSLPSPPPPPPPPPPVAPPSGAGLTVRIPSQVVQHISIDLPPPLSPDLPSPPVMLFQ